MCWVETGEPGEKTHDHGENSPKQKVTIEATTLNLCGNTVP